MQHATSISAEEQRIAALRSGTGLAEDGGGYVFVLRSHNSNIYLACTR